MELANSVKEYVDSTGAFGTLIFTVTIAAILVRLLFGPAPRRYRA